MRRATTILAAALLACQPPAPEAPTQMTEAQRQAIEGEVRAILDTVYAAAREIRFDPIAAIQSSEEGICVWQARIYPCSEVIKGYREAWDPANPKRPRAQEMDSVELKIHVLTPDVAVAARTTGENRVIAADGKVTRATFGSMYVFRKEGGEWKSHSGMQAAWPIDTAAAR